MIQRRQAKAKIVRRLGKNIFGLAKYDAILRKRAYPPGMHGRNKRRGRLSEYGKQLIEKQKIRFAYGVSEQQFVNIYKKAKRMSGITGYNMLLSLERRLDNVIYLSGLALSRNQARQLVSHGHFCVNGHRVNIPSISVKINDVISIRSKEATQKLVRSLLSSNPEVKTPSWMTLMKDDLSVKILAFPQRDEIENIADEQLVVEFYSR